jgi:di/tricarboxylate transporter
VTPEIAMVLAILAAAVILLVTEWVPMEVTALLVLGTVALTGLVRPSEALAGFSSPAVVTVWAVFIVSGGLTHTGVADIIGRLVLRLAGSRETTMIAVIMITAGVMSAVMNNVAVAALMLPVVMDIARQTGRPPSRLLLPLAYGSLLGGLTTQIGTPPNILVTDFLRDEGYQTFTFFDFTPIGLAVMAGGIVFMLAVGRYLLPEQSPVDASSPTQRRDWQGQYRLQDRLFSIRIPESSVLVKKTLVESRIGSVLGLNVLGITRQNRTLLSPGPSDGLEAGDVLTVQGRLEDMQQIRNWQHLVIEETGVDLAEVYADETTIAESRLPAGSDLVGKTLNSLGFRQQYGANVLAIRRSDEVKRTHLQDEPLAAGDVLLIAGCRDPLQQIQRSTDFTDFRYVPHDELFSVYHLHDRLMLLRIPPESTLAGLSLRESRLGAALGSRVFGILRSGQSVIMPEPNETLQAGDRLVVEGRRSDLEILKGLEELQVERRNEDRFYDLLSGEMGVVEAILSPHSNLSGMTLRQLRFREKYGLNILAILRGSQAHYSNLQDVALRFGDALLLTGPQEKLRLLGSEPDFIVLTGTMQERPRLEKAKFSISILAMVLLPVILGWVPIYIAAVIGAALMILSGCLTMEEAYRQIEWKAVFLIAGMLPLGTALDSSGAARLIAENVVAWVGPLGPSAVMLGLILLTFLATCFVPTAALVVLMAPIVLSTAAKMGLSPYGLMMAVAMAASASFMTPIAHPANILVMGPGGYRFIDYIKIGGLLTAVVILVLMAVMPLLWPLTPAVHP